MKRIAALLTSLFIMATFGFASPAAANGAGSYGCADADDGSVRVCLYDSINNYVADGFWQRDANQLSSPFACQALNTHSWHNGGTVADAASSIVVSSGLVDVGASFKVRFYDWINCSSANGYFDMWVPGGDYGRVVNLSSTGPQQLNWYNRIGSFQITFYP